MTGNSAGSRLRPSQRIVVAYTLYFLMMMFVVVFVSTTAVVFSAIATNLDSSASLRAIARMFQYIWSVSALGTFTFAVLGVRYLRREIVSDAARAAAG